GNLSDYVSSISCTKNGAADVSGTGTSVDVNVGAGDVEVCAILNRRKASITLRKSLAPASDSGRFDLLAGSTVLASAVGDGGSGSASVAAGRYTLAERAAAGGLGHHLPPIPVA